MLKLEQIKLLQSKELIVEVLEPIVYKQIGTVIKSEESIAREKQQANFLISKVVALAPKYDGNADIKIGTYVMVSRGTFQPITFPVEGYDVPKLSIMYSDAITAIITE
jgi:hypothetical protein